MSKPRKIPVGNRNIVGAKVAQVRKEKGIKQKDLVAALQSRGMDICDTSMSRLEGQNRMVQDFEVPILAEALGVSIEWLLSQEKEKREED
ncbi:MAG: helix-turn-helix domain-containing protein [Christensenellaceae bacterium]|nr:helix-turn-helix domain-containing protein [Christensenellaceae bacterium]